MPETYFIIGSGVDADYSTLETFVAATSGIKLDSNVPYVALLQDHVHTFGSLEDGASIGDGTDEDHYYIFKPQNKLWQGEEDTTDCVILQPRGEILRTYNFPYFSRIYNVVFEGETIIEDDKNDYIINSQGTIVNGCLFKSFGFYSTSTGKAYKLEFFSGNLIVRDYNYLNNCVFTDIALSGAQSNNEPYINFNNIVNNSVFKNISNYHTYPHNAKIKIGHCYNTLFDTDIDISLALSPASISNNAFTSSGIIDGNNDDQFVYYDTTNHYISGTYLTADTALGKGSGIDTVDNPGWLTTAYDNKNFSMNPGSINGLEYWPYNWYDVGPLYFTKNILVLTQNDQSIIFRTK